MPFSGRDPIFWQKGHQFLKNFIQRPQPGKAGNNKLQTPSTKQIPKYNIQISNKIQKQLFGILNFSHCDLFVICYLSIVIY
jgi:hypothetical protein